MHIHACAHTYTHIHTHTCTNPMHIHTNSSQLLYFSTKLLTYCVLPIELLKQVWLWKVIWPFVVAGGFDLNKFYKHTMSDWFQQFDLYSLTTMQTADVWKWTDRNKVWLLLTVIVLKGAVFHLLQSNPCTTNCLHTSLHGSHAIPELLLTQLK